MYSSANYSRTYNVGTELTFVTNNPPWVRHPHQGWSPSSATSPRTTCWSFPPTKWSGGPRSTARGSPCTGLGQPPQALTDRLRQTPQLRRVRLAARDPVPWEHVVNGAAGMVIYHHSSGTGCEPPFRSAHRRAARGTGRPGPVTGADGHRQRRRDPGAAGGPVVGGRRPGGGDGGRQSECQHLPVAGRPPGSLGCGPADWQWATHGTGSHSRIRAPAYGGCGGHGRRVARRSWEPAAASVHPLRQHGSRSGCNPVRRVIVVRVPAPPVDQNRGLRLQLSRAMRVSRSLLSATDVVSLGPAAPRRPPEAPRQPPDSCGSIPILSSPLGRCGHRARSTSPSWSTTHARIHSTRGRPTCSSVTCRWPLRASTWTSRPGFV